MSEINSNAYWDTRFIENWETYSGPNQSRFFARLAIQHLPSWLLSAIKRESLTLADWGCAQGDGTNEWANFVSSKQLTGIDFSSVAVAQATERYPAIRFVAENWLSNDAANQKNYDFVFSSNVMEHFHSPYDVLHTLCEKAQKGVILALPYREMLWHEEHFFTFLADNVPLVLPNNYRLAWSQIIDCKNIANTHWSGDQIILLYARTDWVDSLGLTLNDCLVEHEDFTSERTQLKSALTELDEQIAELKITYAEREDELQTNLLALQKELRQVEQLWLNKNNNQESHYKAERTDLQAKLDKLQEALLTAQQGKTDQLQTCAERERELLADLLAKQVEFRQVDQVWLEKANQQAVGYIAERSNLQNKLDAVQENLLNAEREKLQLLEVQTQHERRLQEKFVSAQVENEMLRTEYIWKNHERQINYTSELSSLKTKLDELQHNLLTTEQEKVEQAQTYLEKMHTQIQANAEREKMLNEQIQMLDKAGQQWELTATKKQNEINIILNSKFWLITTPLRKLMWRNSELNNDLNQEPFLLNSIPFDVEKTLITRIQFSNDNLESVAHKEKYSTITDPNTRESLDMKSIQALLSPYGEEFVSKSYLAILGRYPDSEGLTYYLNKLRIGVSKIEILTQLRASKEGKEFNSNITGLDETIRYHKFSKLPFMGWINPCNDQIDNKLRIIENRLFEINDVSSRARIEQLEAQIVEKNNYIEDKEIYIAQLLLNISLPNSYEQNKQGTSLLSDDLIIITGVPFDDVGGGQRAAQIARCALKTGRRVIYVYIYEKFDFSLNQHTKSDINILGLTHCNIDSITPSELLTWVSAKSTLLIELPHPKILPYLDLAKSRGLKTVFELIDDWETNLGGDWFEKKAYLKFVQDSDMVIGTANILVERLIGLGRKDAVYLPNAANEIIFDKYKSFSRPSDLPSNGKRIALYFGSLYGEWFAWDYIIEAGNTCKDIDIVLIGDNPGKIGLPSNIHFLGAKKIDELPGYLFHSDVALLPFSPGKISNAVSPIKVFEYLFMGKPVISTDIPEIVGYPGVSIAKSIQEFAKLCSSKSKINNSHNNDLFISKNSWFTRLDSLIGTRNYSQFTKNVSAIVLIHNNINIIERCIESLLWHGKDFLKEIIVVDNNSSDGGSKLIEEKYPSVIVVRNPINGCSSGRNLAASLAKGKYFAFFDSDQWLTSSSCFVEALSILERDACIGAVGWAAGWFDQSRKDLAGVITEYVPNRGMNITASVKGYRDDIGYLGTGGFFILKKTYDSLGGFDTFYDPTCFEDTDLSFQIKNLGLKICFRDLTGIRHQPHQTTSADSQSDKYKKLFDRNSQYFKSKWKDYPDFFVEYTNNNT